MNVCIGGQKNLSDQPQLSIILITLNTGTDEPLQTKSDASGSTLFAIHTDVTYQQVVEWTFSITKTCLFKFTEKFYHQKMKIFR